jgi:long-subunit fatty acid transport protein
MNRRFQYVWSIGGLVMLVALQGYAQYPEDALRLSLPGIGVGARALGMGNAYVGVASDYSALYWNPAGLAQARFSEFMIGLSYTGLNDQSTFYGSTQPYTSSKTTLNALGLVYPLPVRRGSAAIALGYNRESNFNSGVSFSGFNPDGSYIQTWAPQGGRYNLSDLPYNLAFQIWLADTLGGRFASPVLGRTTQGARIIEDGGLNDWSFGGAFEVARNFSVGGTLTYTAGSYSYRRNYSEEDTHHLYDTLKSDYSNIDFQKLYVDDYIDGDIYGWGGQMGFMYRVPERFRFGFTVKFPTWYSVSEGYGTSAQSFFDNGDNFTFQTPPGAVHYEVITPWKFSGGLSFIIRNLVLAGDVEFVDWRSQEFRDAPPEVMNLNTQMQDVFREAFNYRGGLELDFSEIGFRVRGGFIYNTSPYKDDPSAYDQKIATGGIGLLLGPTVMLDVAYAHGWWQTFRINDGISRTDEDVTSNNVMMTMLVRF